MGGISGRAAVGKGTLAKHGPGCHADAMIPQRLDQLLVDRGLAESREKAQRLILAGQVRVNGGPAGKPGHKIKADADVAVIQPERFVSRGGEKLDAAFAQFPLDVAGKTGADVGASTGGFTDCLLQHGAARVYAVDVGRAQLHPRIAQDPRVVVMDGVNARSLEPSVFPGPLDFVTADVSFISLTKILRVAAALLCPGGDLITLIKPQFEAGREAVGRGGVVRDPAVHQEVIERVRRYGTEQAGLEWRGICPSPLRGPAGNVEFLAWWRKP